MLKNLYAILIAGAILGTSLCAGSVLAQEGPPPGGMMGGPPGGMMGGPPPVPPPLMMALRAANLTDDQKKQVHTIMDSNRTTIAPLTRILGIIMAKHRMVVTYRIDHVPPGSPQPFAG